MGSTPAHSSGCGALLPTEFLPEIALELDGTGHGAAGQSQAPPQESGTGRHACQATSAPVTCPHVGFAKCGGMGCPSTRPTASGRRAPWQGSFDTLCSDPNTGF